jgi:hypothetical protein
MKDLPIGISTLKFLVEDGLVYVDKTEIIHPLVRQKGRYFLSRPRRFGKSLLVDTFKQLFEGNEPLFRNLAIHPMWDWSKKYPVVKIDFASGGISSAELLHTYASHILKDSAKELKLPGLDASLPIGLQLENLISGAAEQYGMPVVVLVDEYDKPLLDNIEKPEKALEIREGLRNFYSPLKRLDGILQFVFLTGVSNFSKINIFSGINNLKDITLDSNYATLCGYTQEDLETVFAEHLAGVDWEQLKTWYNGYNYLGDAVYNPFDILLFISENKTYRNYWFETGTPSFLVKLMQKNRYFLPDLENIEAGEELLSSFEIESMQAITLLFQSGYLSIKDREFRRSRLVYKLGFPNLEVRSAFTDYLITSYTRAAQEKIAWSDQTWEALKTGNLAALEGTLRRLFAAIPWRNFTNNDLADYEGFYASVLYAYFSAATGTVIPEDTTNHGQADITVRLDDKVYVMEIKVIPGKLEADAPNTALEQVRKRNYAEKYRGEPGVQVFELGLIFNQEARNLERFNGAVSTGATQLMR